MAVGGNNMKSWILLVLLAFVVFCSNVYAVNNTSCANWSAWNDYFRTSYTQNNVTHYRTCNITTQIRYCLSGMNQTQFLNQTFCGPWISTTNSTSNQTTNCTNGQPGPCYTPSGKLCDYHKMKFEGYYSSIYGCINACGLGNAGPCQCYSLVCGIGQHCSTLNGISCVP